MTMLMGNRLGEHSFQLASHSERWFLCTYNPYVHLNRYIHIHTYINMIMRSKSQVKWAKCSLKTNLVRWSLDSKPNCFWRTQEKHHPPLSHPTYDKQGYVKAVMMMMMIVICLSPMSVRKVEKIILSNVYVVQCTYYRVQCTYHGWGLWRRTSNSRTAPLRHENDTFMLPGL